MTAGTVNRNLEDFFLMLSLELGLSPLPQYGIERTNAAVQVASHMWYLNDRQALPDFRKGLWIRSVPGLSAQGEYILALTDVYLDWLYAHTRR